MKCYHDGSSAYLALNPDELQDRITKAELGYHTELPLYRLMEIKRDLEDIKDFKNAVIDSDGTAMKKSQVESILEKIWCYSLVKYDTRTGELLFRDDIELEAAFHILGIRTVGDLMSRLD
ncbi:MAG: hypothetical protein QW292_14490 [Candidatus Parvarchaeota archaeon]